MVHRFYKSGEILREKKGKTWVPSLYEPVSKQQIQEHIKYTDMDP